MGASAGSSSTTITTMWFVTAAVPRDVLTAEPAADRGFARKYLAQLAVELPDAGFSAPVHIGDFDMNRSTLRARTSSTSAATQACRSCRP